MLLILSGLYLLLHSHLPFLPYFQSTDMQKVMVVLGEFLILAVLARYLEKNPIKKATDAAAILFFFLLLNCLLLQPLIAIYFDPSWEDVPVVRKFRSIFFQISSYLFPLTGVAALFSWRTINRGRLWLQSQFMSAEKDTGYTPILKTGSNSPPEYSQDAHPRRKFYNWLYFLLVVLLTAAGLYLRGNSLTGFVTDDETNHLATALQFIQGTPWKGLLYTRGLYTVTAPLIAGFKLGGVSLVTARWVAIIFNTLAIIPLYFLMKRTNKTLAIFAVMLYLLNPWMLETSRIVREYAFAPLYFYTVALVMQIFYDSFPSDFVFPRDLPGLINARTLITTILLFFFLFYVLVVDAHATSKVILGVYLAFGLLLLRKINWHKKKNLYLLVIPAIMLVVFTLNLDMLEGQYSGFHLADFSNYFISFFFSQPLLYTDPIQQWNYGYGLSTVLVILLALLSTQFRERNRFAVPLSWLSFLITLGVFTIFTVQGLKPRYAIYIQIWFIPITAAGLYTAFLLGKKMLNSAPLASLGIVLLFFNFPYITSTNLEYIPYIIPGSRGAFFTSGNSIITNEYYSDLEPASTLLSENLSNEDALVTTSFLKRYMYWQGIESEHLFLYWYDLDPGKQSIFAGIRSSEEGWIALDYERGYLWSFPLPLDEFEYAGKHVDWKGWYGDVLIYHWFRPRP